MKILFKWLASALAFLLVAEFVPGITVTGFKAALSAAFFWGLLGVTLRPILLVLALPITILTLGLFSFVINALLLWFMSGFLEGFEVTGFVAALYGAVALSVIHWLLYGAFASKPAVR